MKGKITFLLFCLVGLAACSDENNKLRKEAIADCTKVTGAKLACSCILEQLENKYSLAEIQEMSRKLVSGQPPEHYLNNILKAGEQCRNKL